MYQIDILKWEMAKFSLRIKFLEHFDLQTLIIFLSKELFLEFTPFSIFELDPFRIETFDRGGKRLITDRPSAI